MPLLYLNYSLSILHPSHILKFHSPLFQISSPFCKFLFYFSKAPPLFNNPIPLASMISLFMSLISIDWRLMLRTFSSSLMNRCHNWRRSLSYLSHLWWILSQFLSWKSVKHLKKFWIIFIGGEECRHHSMDSVNNRQLVRKNNWDYTSFPGINYKVNCSAIKLKVVWTLAMLSEGEKN